MTNHPLLVPHHLLSARGDSEHSPALPTDSPIPSGDNRAIRLCIFCFPFWSPFFASTAVLPVPSKHFIHSRVRDKTEPPEHSKQNIQSNYVIQSQQNRDKVPETPQRAHNSRFQPFLDISEAIPLTFARNLNF